MSVWEHLRDMIIFLLIVALLAWVVLKPKHKVSFEEECAKINGVVAYTALKNEPVCIKGDKK